MKALADHGPGLETLETKGARPITRALLIRDWRKTLDAFGEALDYEEHSFSPSELKQLEQRLAADRRWLQHFAAIRNFP